MSLDVNEVFYSVQGEGVLVGDPSVFLRLNGCNLRCKWCDSTYAFKTTPLNFHFTIDTVQEMISKFECKSLVITGGEPMLQQDSLYDLIGMFPDYHKTIETNGTIDPHPDLFDQVDMWSVSPKKDQTLATHFTRLDEDVWYKFVVDRKDKIDWIDQFITEWKIRLDRIMLMPQAQYLWELHDNLPWVIDLAKERGYRVSPRLHITAYGNKRGV